MKKKLLFVMESLGIGGAEKSLVTLLSELDYSKYEVDLFLFNFCGEFKGLLPKKVRVIEAPMDFKVFNNNPIKALKYFLLNKKYKLLYYKLIDLFILLFNRFVLHREYIGWNFINKSVDRLNKKYDTAIGFMEKKSIYFTIDKVNADKKIGWIHTDYSKIQYNKKLDNEYLKKMDKIVAVSDHCKEALDNVFPELRNKTIVIENMISPLIINKMAKEKVVEIEKQKDEIIICTVARLTAAKGIDIAIECCKRIIDKGLKIRWIVIGDGEERSKLEKLIINYGLQDIFLLLGSKSNPYKYMRICDIYVQPSIWEGFGITVSEAKILCKPILVNNIPEFKQQIDEGLGIIYNNIDEMEVELEELLLNQIKRKCLCENLSQIDKSNIKEVKNINKLLFSK